MSVQNQENFLAESQFLRWNVSLFDCKLPPIPVVFESLELGVMGVFEFLPKRKKLYHRSHNIPDIYSGWMIEYPVIKISDQCLNWRPILLHEMVHAVLAFEGFPFADHDQTFHQRCSDIEKKSGIQIPR